MIMQPGVAGPFGLGIPRPMRGEASGRAAGVDDAPMPETTLEAGDVEAALPVLFAGVLQQQLAVEDGPLPGPEDGEEPLSTLPLPSDEEEGESEGAGRLDTLPFVWGAVAPVPPARTSFSADEATAEIDGVSPVGNEPAGELDRAGMIAEMTGRVELSVYEGEIRAEEPSVEYLPMEEPSTNRPGTLLSATDAESRPDRVAEPAEGLAYAALSVSSSTTVTERPAGQVGASTNVAESTVSLEFESMGDASHDAVASAGDRGDVFVPVGSERTPVGRPQDPRFDREQRPAIADSVHAIATGAGGQDAPDRASALSSIEESNDALQVNGRAERAASRPVIPALEAAPHLAREIKQLTLLGRDRAVMQLDPPELGRLDVRLSVSDSQVTLEMTVASDAVRAILESGRSQLDMELAQHGLQTMSLSIQVDQQGGQSRGQEMPEQAPVPGLHRDKVDINADAGVMDVHSEDASGSRLNRWV
ncbi:MAG TPA: flagellar hook-length control protein FliK [Chloroflexi bacterium]|nr:flagellar hook-length control protein FliK [Chloroflexota bacterium]